jgi:hypothetical protein
MLRFRSFFFDLSPCCLSNQISMSQISMRKGRPPSSRPSLAYVHRMRVCAFIAGGLYISNPFLCSCYADKKCSRCKCAVYCSKDHQVAHWKVHKTVCELKMNGTLKSDAAEVVPESCLFPGIYMIFLFDPCVFACQVTSRPTFI